MSWGNKDPTKPDPTRKIIQWYHKERYHSRYDQNYDSNRVHQVLGKYWFSRTDEGNSQLSTRMNQIYSAIENDDETRCDQNDKEMADKGIYKRNKNLMQTSYGTTNFCAEKVLATSKKQNYIQLKEHKQRQLEKTKKQNFVNGESNEEYEKRKAGLKVKRELRRQQSEVDAGSTLSQAKRNQWKDVRPSSANVSLFNYGRNITTVYKDGYTEDKSMYKNLTSKRSTGQKNNFSKSQMVSSTGFSSGGWKSVTEADFPDQVEEQQEDKVNPFRMSTYDTVFGAPDKKYTREEQPKNDDFKFAKTTKAQYNLFKKNQDQQDNTRSLVSYSGVLPKSLNVKYIWQNHQYERDNFMRQAPIWVSGQGYNSKPRQDHKKRGCITSDSRRRIEGKNYI